MRRLTCPSCSLVDVEVERGLPWDGRLHLLLVPGCVAVLDVEDGQVGDPEGRLDVCVVFVQNGFLVEGLWDEEG